MKEVLGFFKSLMKKEAAVIFVLIAFMMMNIVVSADAEVTINRSDIIEELDMSETSTIAGNNWTSAKGYFMTYGGMTASSLTNKNATGVAIVEQNGASNECTVRKSLQINDGDSSYISQGLIINAKEACTLVYSVEAVGSTTHTEFALSELSSGNKVKNYTIYNFSSNERKVGTIEIPGAGMYFIGNLSASGNVKLYYAALIKQGGGTGGGDINEPENLIKKYGSVNFGTPLYEKPKNGIMPQLIADGNNKKAYTLKINRDYADSFEPTEIGIIAAGNSGAASGDAYKMLYYVKNDADNTFDFKIEMYKNEPKKVQAYVKYGNETVYSTILTN